MTLSSLQGESPVNVLHLLVEIGFSHFINMDSLSFTWYLVAAESRISKQSGVQDALQNSELCRCLKAFEDLSESKC